MESPLLLLLTFLFLGALWATSAAAAAAAIVFTLHNSCPYTVWPGTLSGNGAAVLGGGGFELPSEATASFSAPPGWSGRFWARTHCNFSAPSSSSSSCATGDCSGALRCTLGGATPVTLAEFTLAPASGGQDFYDVSLVDGYNVGIGITAMPPPHAAAAAKVESGANTTVCGYAGCLGDVNEQCPPELRVTLPTLSTSGAATKVVACRSACAAFGAAEYCCTGAYGDPSTCRPTKYSRIFKMACPAAYSYAYDDPTSTFTCPAGARYLITFCPASKTPSTTTRTGRS
ncbi:Pathogenesis-related protein 5 [Ananas comosus]|uniref:Pathogenesis-related protein 5 n=1 Tax=Ananas comosus TaxID=4615 RepID=A0A199W5N8_ANACO|nr:Pathogenesis-related protein 5 [Ananas comosus]